MKDITPSTSKQSLIVTMAKQYAMDPDVFANTIKATCMPEESTNEEFAAFLLVAHTYGLNPLTKEIHAFSGRGGGIVPIVGIDGYMHLAHGHANFDGMEFSYHDDEEGQPYSVTCKVYRTDMTRPMEITEFFSECVRQTGPWKSHPRRMLRHKAAIQAIRYALGFSGIMDEDEAEGLVIDASPVETSSASIDAINTSLGQDQAPDSQGDAVTDQESTPGDDGSADNPSSQDDVTDSQGVVKDSPPKTEASTEVTKEPPSWPFWNEPAQQWVDAGGTFYDKDLHGWSAANKRPSVTESGHFRKRRGTSAQQPEVDGTPQSETQNEPGQNDPDHHDLNNLDEPTQSKPVTYPELRQRISRAQTQGELTTCDAMITAWKDGSEALKDDLRAVLEVTRRKLDSSW